MTRISVSVDERQPRSVQVLLLGCDASVASIGGSSQATLWLSIAEAADLWQRLGEALPRPSTGEQR